MAVRTWEVLKEQYCQLSDAVVKFEAEVVYPADFLPDQAPRILAHRCSHGYQCNLFNQPSCVWAGTNPNYDPFL